MSDFKQRLEDEYCDLMAKIGKLSNFMKSPNFADVDKKQQVLLEQQIQHMADYGRVLRERITLLNIPVK